MEAISSELDIFSKEVFQAAVVSEPIQEFGPIATIQETGPIEFLISGGDRNYVDLNSSKFEVRVKLTKPDGSEIPGTVKLSVANDTLNSLFSNIELELADKPVTEANTLYPYRAFLETILNYPKDVLTTRMICEGWLKIPLEKWMHPTLQRMPMQD